MIRAAGAAAFLIFLTSAASAAPPPQSPLLADLLKCEGMKEDAPRLRCLDAATRALREASQSGRVALIDREKVSGARRSLFGFNLRNIPLFGEAGSGEEQSELRSTVRSATENGAGGWFVTLAEGGVWTTLEPLPLTPRPGSAVVVRRTALGGYMMNVAGRGVRAERRR